MKKLDAKTKKILSIAVNVLIVAIFIFALIFATMAITKIKNGYNNVFGTSIMAARTGSMAGPKKDSFNEKDLVAFKILNAKQKKQLKEGDVIAFWTLIDGVKSINTHRIVVVEQVGSNVSYKTQGDANTAIDGQGVLDSEVIGKFSYKIKKMGGFILFMQSSTGFLLFVVIPSVLALGYAVFLFIVNLRGFNKEKKVEETAEIEARIRAEIAGESKSADNEDDGAKMLKEPQEEDDQNEE